MKRSIFFVVLMLLMVGLTSSAVALDKYQSRTGGFIGLTGHVGAGAVHARVGNFGYSSKRFVDGGVGLEGGFGINEMFVPVGSFLWIGNGQANGELSSNFNFMAGLDFFPWKGIVVGFQGGLALFHYDRPISGSDVEVGGGIKPSLGYEIFLNGDNAVGVRFYYLRNFYKNADYDTLGGMVSFRWY